MIQTHDHNSTRTITLDRPDKRNALTPAMLDALTTAFEIDQSVRAVVVSGAGRVFCAGFDLTQCKNDPPSQPTMRALLVGLSRTVRAMRGCPAPIVLGAHGAAIAGGCALLGGADIVVADHAAKLGYPVVKLGVSPAVSAPFLRQGAGDGSARARLLDPALIDGARAHKLGLVHELVGARDEVIDRAHTIARSLASKPGRGAFATKQWLNTIDGLEENTIQRGLDASLSLVGSAEANLLLAQVWA